MSGIGELAYTVLLGWMRAVVDWVWSMVSGTGNSGVWQWFLSNWKIWLVILLVGGLVIDWLMWMVRWRPHRLLLSRFRRGPAAAPAEAPAWDGGEGFYDDGAEDAMEGGDWSETAFTTLSELDPGWAGDVVIEPEDDLLYDPNYDPAHNTASHYTGQLNIPGGDSHVQDVPSDTGYWDVTPDELPYEEIEAAPAETPPAAPILAWDDDLDGAEEETVYVAGEASAQDGPPPGIDPFAPYDAYVPEEAAYGATETPADDAPPAASPEEDSSEAPEDEPAPQMYGRPGLWPGMFAGIGGKVDKPKPVLDDVYDPLFNPDAPRPEETGHRRRRRVRESAPEDWQPEAPMPSWVEPPAPEPEAPDGAYDLGYPDAARRRPERVVKPASAASTGREDAATPPRGRGRKKEERGGLRTVTGKPALRKGIFRLTAAYDEPISGLPPMEVGDAFHEAVRPYDPDFEPDEGEEFEER